MPVCHPVTVRQGITLHIKQSSIQRELSFQQLCVLECVCWGMGLAATLLVERKIIKAAPLVEVVRMPSLLPLLMKTPIFTPILRETVGCLLFAFRC